MKRYLVFLVITMNIVTQLSGQQASATISTISSCYNSSVTVPLDVENFMNIGAMSLYIGYDTAQLTFVSIQNIHPVFQSLIFNSMVVPLPQIGVSFTSINGVSLLSGRLFEMVFNFKSNSASLHFNPGCEIIDPNFEEIPVLYSNGAVVPVISLLNQPQNITVTAPEPAYFSVLSAGGKSYQWQRSTNSGSSFTNLENSAVYQGVNTTILQITSSNPLINGTFYRCKIITDDCIVYSDYAVLTVVLNHQQHYFFSAGWNSLATCLVPTNPDPEALFAPLLNNLQILLSGDKVYNPSAGINTLGEFDAKLGYAIKLNNDASFTISGLMIESQPLIIKAGWSYLPVTLNCNADISTFFGKEINEVEIIMELPGLNMYWPEHNITTLNTLIKGKSYKVKMKSMVEITTPNCN